MLETTILVSFNGGEPDNSDYIIIAELDGELNTDSDGNNKTSLFLVTIRTYEYTRPTMCV